MNAFKERANAKINLYLDVISKGEDGFHKIKTVMHSVDLFDTLTVKRIDNKEGKISLYIKNGKFLPRDARNIAYRAAKLFMEYAGINSSIEIRLDKNIPVAAGLAGGSTDAAAVLRAMNKLFGRPFSSKMMLKIAAELGSDVPYCLLGKTALCEGRGEIMTKLADGLKLYAVIAISSEHVSTPIAYSELDRYFNDFDGTVPHNSENAFENLISSIKEGKIFDGALYNIFEQSVLPKCQGATAIKERLISLGATTALMSGSGPSVFGLFKNMEDAQMAKQELTREGIRAFAVKSV
jgi:4-diphosphocytidyl-2-C-methyl-D-erythritol kinase